MDAGWGEGVGMDRGRVKRQQGLTGRDPEGGQGDLEPEPLKPEPPTHQT